MILVAVKEVEEEEREKEERIVSLTGREYARKIRPDGTFFTERTVLRRAFHYSGCIMRGIIEICFYP